MRPGPTSPVMHRPCAACALRPGEALVPVGDAEARLCWTCAHQVTDHDLELSEAGGASCDCVVEAPAPKPERADFVLVLESVRSGLRAYALRLTRSSSAADDLLQETATKAWLGWSSFDASRRPRPWFYTIMRNVWHDSWKRDQRIPTDSPADLDQLAGDGGTEANSWASFLDARRAIDDLDRNQREVLELAIAGEPYAGIASTLGIPIGTVMSRLFRARKKLEALSD